MISYYTYYAILGFFTVYHWKEIWKAAKGGNGMPQPNELTKLFFVFVCMIYCNEIIFRGVEFNWDFGLFIALMMGVANIGDINGFFKRGASS